jgi:hypothetical protein
MSAQGQFLRFAFGQRAPFCGATVAGKARIYQGAWDFERRHPFQRFNYTGASQVLKRFTFGLEEAGAIAAGRERHTTARSWGWEDGDGLEAVSGAIRSVSGRGDAFRVDVEPGYYVVTAGFRGGTPATGPFELALNDDERRSVLAPADGSPRTELLGGYARDGKLRLNLRGRAGWCLSRLAVQPLVYRSEDFFLDRGMWVFPDLPDVDERVTLAAGAPVPDGRAPAEDWRWNARIAHLGRSVCDSRDSLVRPADIERRLNQLRGQGYTAVMLDGWHMWCSFQDRLDTWTESARRCAEAAQRLGLRVVDHFDVPCVVYAGTGYAFLLKYLDWCQRDVRTGEPTLRMFCLNHPEFRRTFLTFLETYARRTGVDGFLLDECTFAGETFCGCVHCRRVLQRVAAPRLRDCRQHGRKWRGGIVQLRANAVCRARQPRSAVRRLHVRHHGRLHLHKLPGGWELCGQSGRRHLWPSGLLELYDCR